jgi:hypothetical protein
MNHQIEKKAFSGSPVVHAALLLPFLLIACGGGSSGSKPDAQGSAGTGGAGTSGAAGAGMAGTGAAGSDAAAGAGGQDAAVSDATDAPTSDVADAPAGPAPVLLARIPGCGDARLALSGGKVLWTERATGLVRSLAPSGAATPMTIAINQNLPGPIAADDTNVYWANEGDKAIMKAPIAGAGAAAPLLTAPAIVGGLVASGGTLYYGAGPSTFKVAAAGGAPTTLMTFAVCRQPTDVGALALDVDHLYQTDHNNQYLTREKIDGTQLLNNQCATDPTTAPQIMAPNVISHSQGSLLFDALAVANGEIVWADNSNLNAKVVAGDNTVGSRNVGHTLNNKPITGFAVGGTKIYFGESNDPVADPGGDDIEVTPFDPGEAGADDPVIVAHGQHNATSFVADATHLYWVTHAPALADGGADECAIMSLAIGAAAP